MSLPPQPPCLLPLQPQALAPLPPPRAPPPPFLPQELPGQAASQSRPPLPSRAANLSSTSLYAHMPQDLRLRSAAKESPANPDGTIIQARDSRSVRILDTTASTFGGTAPSGMSESQTTEDAAFERSLSGTGEIQTVQLRYGGSAIAAVEEDRWLSKTALSSAKLEDSPCRSQVGTVATECASTVVSEEAQTQFKAMIAEFCGSEAGTFATEGKFVSEDAPPPSKATIAEFFTWYADELHLSLVEAKAKADMLGKEELLWTTEDLYFLHDKETFLQLPLPLHVRRWLFKERCRRLADPLRFQPHECATPHGSLAPLRRPLDKARTVAQKRIAFPCVEVTVQINSISRLYVQDLQFDIDFTLMLDWVDQSVIQRTVEEVEIWNIFNPDIDVENAIGPHEPMAGTSLRPRMHSVLDGRCVDGRMKKTCRYRIQLMFGELDLRAFPFDGQTLPIRLKARAHQGLGEDNCTAYPVTLVGPEGFAGNTLGEGLRACGHTVAKTADHLSEWRVDSLMGVRTEIPNRWYDLNIIVSRDPSHVMWNVFFPNAMILIFSFTVYAIPIDQLNGRLEITSTCLLGMMAFQGTVKEMLPPMPYLTAMGKYVIGIFTVLIIHGVEHAMAFILSSQSTQARSRSQPSDPFFGLLEFWDERSEDPAHWEVMWIYVELVALILFHAIFLFRLRRKRRMAVIGRELEARKPGVSLVLVTPQSKVEAGNSRDMCASGSLHNRFFGN